MLRESRGISTIGFLVFLAIVVAGFYVGYRFAQVQWNVESFKEEMTELTRFFAADRNPNNLNTSSIKAEVIRRAEKCGFELVPEDIQVDLQGVDINITATWIEPITFPGGYIYEREISVSRSMRKFGY